MNNRTLFFLTTVLSLSLITPFGASAHPGRTDSKGGHTCQTNCAQWGLSTGEHHLHSADGWYTNSQGQKYDKEGNVLSNATKPPATPAATALSSSTPTKTVVSSVTATPEPTPTASPSPQSSSTPAPTTLPAEESGSGILWTIFLLFAIPIALLVYLYRKYRK